MNLADIPVDSEHRNLNLQDVAIDGEGAFKNLIDWRHRFNAGLGSNTGESPKLAGRGRTQIQGQPQAVQSTEELFEAVVASVMGGDALPGYEESFLGDDFFVDDVMQILMTVTRTEQGSNSVQFFWDFKLYNFAFQLAIGYNKARKVKGEMV